MNGILDRIITLLLVIGYTMVILEQKSIYIVLVGIIFAGIYYYTDTGKVYGGLHILLYILIMRYEMFLPLILLIIYESCYKAFLGNYKYLKGLFVFLIIYISTWKMGNNRYLWMDIWNQWEKGFLFMIVIASVIYLAFLSSKYSELKIQALKIRDDNEEFRRITIQKNDLLERQKASEIMMATLKERNRIAREIHDNVGHLLSRSIIQIGALQVVYKDQEVSKSLKQIGEALDESLTSIHQSIHDLFNDSIDLEKSIYIIIEKYTEYRIKLDYNLNQDLTKEIKFCFLSIVQEAIGNVKKHSNADTIEIIIREHPGFYQLIIEDNGEPNKIQESGIGLHTMESRVHDLNGNIHFSIEKGFKIFITIPKI